MLTPSLLLLAAGLLGAFDIVYFHWYRCGLGERPESRTEVVIHVARGLVFAVQLVIVPSVRFGGGWYPLLVAILLADMGSLLALNAQGGYALELETFYLVGGLTVVLLGSGRFGAGIGGRWN